MNLQKDLNELLDAGIITPDIADRINQYYHKKAAPPQNKLLIVFGILGAILVGLGIILILAHNWDQLSRGVKTFFAFFPLITGQALCAYSLFKKPDSRTWKESTSAFLFIAIGACISLIGQIYNVPGSLSGYLLTWVLLGIPIVYLMNSSIASLMYIIGITIYGCATGYWDQYTVETYWYWGLLLLALPHYYHLYLNKTEGNFFTFHNWFIPISVIIVLGSFATDFDELMFVAYISLFSCLYIIGHLPLLRKQKVRNNGYLVLGSLGTVGLLMGLSFDWFWQDMRSNTYSSGEITGSIEFWVSVFLTLMASTLLIIQKKGQNPKEFRLTEIVFILFIGIFALGILSAFAAVFVNLLVLAIGITTIRDGARQDHLGILNYGLLIITGLVICRFFDTDLSFIIRGILFVAVGFAFFFVNYKMIQKRKSTDIDPGHISYEKTNES